MTAPRPTTITLRIGPTDVDLENGVVRYVSKFVVDADGSPRAYHPQSAKGLDNLQNAGHADRWIDADDAVVHDLALLARLQKGEEIDGYRFQRRSWPGLVCDPSGQPYVQGPTDPCPGGFISGTALSDHTKHESDPSAYVDSETVPYISVPRPLVASLGVRPGDLAWVRFGGHETGAIVADIGPAARIGEGSIALAKLLGIPSSARNGGCDNGVEWFIFVGSASSPPWPRGAIQAMALALKGQRGI